MRCLGRTTRFHRCKIDNTKWYFPFCHRHHWWQPIMLLFITIPTIIGVYGGLYRDVVEPMLLDKVQLELEINNPGKFSYIIKNPSDKIAEKILVHFLILEIDSDTLYNIPKPVKGIDYINPKSKVGPIFYLMDQYKREGHNKYFGVIYFVCKGCSNLNQYWVYLDYANKGLSFYAKSRTEIGWSSPYKKCAPNEFQKYLDTLIPLEDRVPIK